MSRLETHLPHLITKANLIAGLTAMEERFAQQLQAQEEEFEQQIQEVRERVDKLHRRVRRVLTGLTAFTLGSLLIILLQ